MRILWVENNAQFVVATKREFLHRHSVTVIPTLVEAVQLLMLEPFDVVLLDYDLDDGKGSALLPTINIQIPRPVVIAASSHSFGNNTLVEAGADLVCPKRKFHHIEAILEQAANLTGAKMVNTPLVSNATEFQGHSWDTLPEDIVRVCEPWQRNMREYDGDPEEWRGSSTENMVQRLLWLIPLAKYLQERPALRVLYPFVHHFLLQLSCQPTTQAYFPCYFVIAGSEEQFMLEYVMGPKDRNKDPRHGSMSEIAEWLELAILQRERDDPGA